ncbi:MAG: hypothetical protein K6A65_03865 [Succinivibrionaceae bacterium]|nr:hypothetical protein [Succinivibrionaceae bacterium]
MKATCIAALTALAIAGCAPLPPAHHHEQVSQQEQRPQPPRPGPRAKHEVDPRVRQCLKDHPQWGVEKCTADTHHGKR